MMQAGRSIRVNELELTRLFRAPAAALWCCWSEPALLAKWWAPSPVLTRDVVLELRAGGRFSAMQQTPDGAQDVTEYCILAVEAGRMIILTDMLTAGFRPAANIDIGFTATVRFDAESGGTRYTVRLTHADAAVAQRHEKLGFHETWGIASSQLGALAESLHRQKA
jgi:uncharacterized protein YndB with AHSA1/START domain